MELDPQNIDERTPAPEERVILVFSEKAAPPQSLLARMIDKGALTLSLDRALWALAAIIAAINAPDLLARILEHMDFSP